MRRASRASFRTDDTSPLVAQPEPAHSAIAITHPAIARLATILVITTPLSFVEPNGAASDPIRDAAHALA